MQIQYGRNKLNSCNSKKKIFINYGWPDAFDSEGFERAKTRYEQDLRELESRIDSAKGEMVAEMVAERGLNSPLNDEFLAQLPGMEEVATREARGRLSEFWLLVRKILLFNNAIVCIGEESQVELTILLGEHSLS